MSTVSIVYFSGTGHTTKLAEAVAKGVSSVAGVKAELLPIKGEDIVNGRFKNEAFMAKLDASDAIIFGSPTYMGSVAGQFKCFADATAERWFGRKWVNKIAAGFTISGGPSGDKLSTLQYLSILAMQHGMLWVGLEETAYNDKGINRLSAHLGVIAQAGMEPVDVAPNDADKLTGELLGKRVAQTTIRWAKGA